MGFEAVGHIHTFACVGQTSFTIPFQFLVSSDIGAWTHSDADFDEDTATPLYAGDDFTIAGDGPNGAGLLQPSPILSSGFLTVRRHVSRDMDAAYTAFDGFPAESHARQLTRLSMAAEEGEGLAADIRARALMVAPGQTPPRFPSITSLLGKLLGVDLDGNFYGSAGGGADEGLRPDLAGNSGAGLIGWLRSATGAVKRSLSDMFAYGSINVRDFGVTGDGVTDDKLAIRAAVAHWLITGGTLRFPRGVYLTSGTVQVDLDLAWKAAGDPLAALRACKPLRLKADGAIFKGTVAQAIFRFKGSQYPRRTRIEGVYADHLNDANANAMIELENAHGFDIIGGGAMIGGNKSGYATYLLKNSDAEDIDTGSFWNTLADVSVRADALATADAPCIVKVTGTANALTIRGSLFSDAVDAIRIEAQGAIGRVANAVRVMNNSFEQLSGACVHAIGTPQEEVNGLMIAFNRIENVDSVLHLEGVSIGNQAQPPLMIGNYGGSPIGVAVNNPNDLVYSNYDSWITPSDPAGGRTVTYYGFDHLSLEPDTPPLTATKLDNGPVFAMRYRVGSVLRWVLGFVLEDGSRIRLTPFAPPGYTGQGAAFHVEAARLTHGFGPSGGATACNNFGGTGQIDNTADEEPVVFPIAEADANYEIAPVSYAAASVWCDPASRTINGFTMKRSGTSGNQAFAWRMFRV